jgi:hypothetical protein
MLRCWHDPGVIGDRRARYATASASLASLSDSELAALVDDGVGVGGDSVALNAAGVPVFAKRVALTGRELARPHSTANLFDCRCTASTVSVARASADGVSFLRT